MHEDRFKVIELADYWRVMRVSHTGRQNIESTHKTKREAEKAAKKKERSNV